MNHLQASTAKIWRITVAGYNAVAAVPRDDLVMMIEAGLNTHWCVIGLGEGRALCRGIAIGFIALVLRAAVPERRSLCRQTSHRAVRAVWTDPDFATPRPALWIIVRNVSDRAAAATTASRPDPPKAYVIPVSLEALCGHN
jgi:hypothetical protein